jgi:hypothetical protein
VTNLTQGPSAIFKAYSWSLDTFVDYAWRRLTDLNTVLIVLLVVETLCVQVGGLLGVKQIRLDRADTRQHFPSSRNCPNKTADGVHVHDDSPGSGEVQVQV